MTLLPQRPECWDYRRASPHAPYVIHFSADVLRGSPSPLTPQGPLSHSQCHHPILIFRMALARADPFLPGHKSLGCHRKCSVNTHGLGGPSPAITFLDACVFLQMTEQDWRSPGRTGTLYGDCCVAVPGDARLPLAPCWGWHGQFRIPWEKVGRGLCVTKSPGRPASRSPSNFCLGHNGFSGRSLARHRARHGVNRCVPGCGGSVGHTPPTEGPAGASWVTSGASCWQKDPKER
jgi:hypothetical protein